MSVQTTVWENDKVGNLVSGGFVVLELMCYIKNLVTSLTAIITTAKVLFITIISFWKSIRQYQNILHPMHEVIHCKCPFLCTSTSTSLGI
jgi:hypothetical protein